MSKFAVEYSGVNKMSSKLLGSSNNVNSFAIHMADEYKRANDKFPKGNRLLGALMEEVGELAEALLKIDESGDDPQKVYNEAVQVASTAMRLAIQGESDYNYSGTRCHYSGCKQNCHGGPCALCYE